MKDAMVVLWTLIIYKIILIAIGVWASRRTRDTRDFFLGGRGLGPWVAAISASASSSSAWTLLGVSGAAFAWGLSAVWLFPACVGGFLINWFLVAPRLQKLTASGDALTLTDILSQDAPKRWRRSIVLSASAIILFSLLFYVASQFQGSGKTFSTTFGLSMTTSIMIGGLIVMVYTVLGGFWAVSVTDTLQGMVMAATAVILPIVTLAQVGDPGSWLDALAAVDVEGFGDPFRRGFTPAGIGFVIGLLGIGLGYPGQPHVVNRFMALRDQASVKQARRIAIGWALVVYSGMLVTGWMGRVVFNDLGDSETIFIMVTNELFHPVVAGVMIAAVLSAIMSTADSQLLVAASSVTSDLRVRGSDAPAHARTIMVSRLVVVALCIAAVALALSGSQRIFSKVLFAWSAMGAAFGPLLLVRLRLGPVRAGHALVAMWAGFATSVIAYNIGQPLGIKDSYGGLLERVLPFVFSLAIAYRGHRADRP